jgi:hypothetical protein
MGTSIAIKLSVVMESAGSASAMREQALRFLGLLHVLNFMVLKVPLFWN